MLDFSQGTVKVLWICFIRNVNLPLLGNGLKSLAQIVLILLGLTAAVLATNTFIHWKMFGFGNTTLIISNEETNIMKIINSLKESCLLIKGFIKIIKNEAKE